MTDPHEFAVVAIDVAQRGGVIQLVCGRDTPDHGGIVPAQPVRVVSVVGQAVGTNTLDGVVHGAHRLGDPFGGFGGPVGGPDEERHRVCQPDAGALEVQLAGGVSVLVVLDDP